LGLIKENSLFEPCRKTAS